MKKSPVARKSDLVIQNLESETLVYNVKTNKAFCLNETSAIVWNLCNGKRTAAQISDEMSIQMKTLVDEDIVWLALEQLNKDGLLEERFEENQKFIGQTRREAIKRIALASAIALPIVSSIIAPKAVNAQSVCSVVGITCTCAGGTGSGNTCGQGTGTPLPCPAGCLCRSNGTPTGAFELGACE
jgi:hypothetical protein